MSQKLWIWTGLGVLAVGIALMLGYMHVQNERYTAWASCMEWADGHDTVNPNWYDICSGVLTHDLAADVAPAQWIK